MHSCSSSINRLIRMKVKEGDRSFGDLKVLEEEDKEEEGSPRRWMEQ